MLENTRREKAGSRFIGIIAAGKLVIDAVKKVVYFGSNRIPLTAGEYRILEYLALNAGRPVSQEEILECAMSYQTAPTTTTVGTRMCLLRRKLNLHGIGDKIQTIRGFGYAFSGPTRVSPCRNEM